MKKLTALLIMIFLTGISFAFADKSRFYKNDKLLDVMYILPEDGLRVRSKPELKSKKLLTLPYRLPVKIVAVGKEATIDGITSNWVEIYIPREYSFGWVFGGYLAKEQPEFIPPRGKNEFKNFLKSCLFAQNNGSKYLYFKEKDGKPFFNFHHAFPGTCLINDAEVTILDDRSFKIDKNNLSYTVTVSDITATDCVFSTIEFYNSNYELEKIEQLKVCYEVGGPVMGDYPIFDMENALDYVTWFSNIEAFGLPCVYLKNGKNKEDMDEYGEQFMEQYHAYWDPIVEEHQKMADEMN